MRRASGLSGLLPGGVVHRLVWIIPLGLLGNLAYTLLATDGEALAATVQLDPVWLAASLLLAVLPLALNALRVWRWGRLLRPGFRIAAAVRTILLCEVDGDNEEVSEEIARVRQRLLDSTDNPLDEPGLYIFETCRHFIRTVPVLP